MIDKVKATILNNNLIPFGATVVVALSGGSDSMALLHSLNILKAEFGFNLRAAHINHCLRGNDADRDEIFVTEKCREMNIPLEVLRVDVAKEAEKNGEGLEECGRRIRYAFFDSLGDDLVIATAHNLSDRVETFLFNFARGSALRGLCSIPFKRNNIVRPLLNCSKEEILRFCSDNGIEYVTDESNSDVAYSRNRIRHNIVTEFHKLNSAFEQVADRCISSINEDEKFLSSLADEVVSKSVTDRGFDASVISESPDALKKRAIVRICERAVGVTPEQKFLPTLCSLLDKGGAMQINGGITVRVRKGILDFPEDYIILPTQELCNGAEFGDKTVNIKTVNIAEINNLQNISKQGLEYFLDYDKIHGRVFIRSRVSGDKITLKTRNCTKTLKKLFNELEIPPEKRASVAVFADDDGVVAVEGVGCDSRVAVSDETKNVLIIKISESGA